MNFVSRASSVKFTFVSTADKFGNDGETQKSGGIELEVCNYLSLFVRFNNIKC